MTRTSKPSVARLCLASWMALALSTGCGGGPAPEARSAEATETTEPKSSRSADGKADQEPGAEAAEGPSRSSCDDGTCFACGSGSCLAGWYCDETASGGAACSWLPACAEKAGCGCVSQVLGKACSCTESGGGSHVTCK